MTEQKISTSRSYELNSTVHLQNSDSRQLLIEQLEACNYTYQEFLLNPLQMGIPNSRLRYYLLVKKNANRDDPSMVLIVLTKVILGKSQAIDVYG
jgi:site-specific DNA-cytosine methylase